VHIKDVYQLVNKLGMKAIVSRALLHRTRVKGRIKWDFCSNHLQYCECDLKYRILYSVFTTRFEEQVLSGVISREEGLKRFSDKEMMMKLIIRLENTFERCGMQFLVRDSPLNELQYSSLIMSTQVGKNQRVIPPLIPSCKLPAGKPVCPIHEKIVEIYREWDIIKIVPKLRAVMNVPDDILIKYIKRGWRLSDLIVEGKIPEIAYENRPAVFSLLDTCIQSMSYYNKVFSHTTLRGRNFVHTISATDNLYPFKLPKVMDRFDKEPFYNAKAQQIFKRFLAPALQMMYHIMGVDKEFGRHRFRFLKEELINILIQDFSSGGITTGSGRVVQHEGNIYNLSYTGKKGTTKYHAIKQIKTAYKEFDGELILPAPNYNLSLKEEVYNTSELPTYEEHEKAADKVRVFVIANSLGYYTSYLVNSLRVKLEQNCKNIMIGFKWDQGGALLLAQLNHYDSDDVEWGTGDFSKLDTTLKKMLLQLFTTESMRYVKNEGTKDHMFHEKLVQYVAKYLGSKVTHMFGDLWRLVLGTMPSGVFETSHGDSWIVLLIYYLFIIYTLHTSRNSAEILHSLVTTKKTGMVDYGDDFIMRWEKKHREEMSVFRFSQFCRNFDMLMRDEVIVESYLSQINSDGEMSKKGVVFLKRYTISSKSFNNADLPAVLPFRPTTDIVKICNEFPWE